MNIFGRPGNSGSAIFSTQGMDASASGNTDQGDIVKQFFHWNGKQKPYFEGWYLKCQTKNGQSIALIPALHIPDNGQQYASLQVITRDGAWWQEFPASAFTAQKDHFHIALQGNLFSEFGISLDLDEKGLSLHGNIAFGPFTELDSDIMGPFRWVPGMECSHSVISMFHSLHGQIEINGNVMDFHNGTGYIESDRGRSFPASYLWTQCSWGLNSLMLSIGEIPFGKLRFTGCICAILLNGRQYRIATYRGAVIERWSHQSAVIRQGKYRLEIRLFQNNPQSLRAPNAGEMDRTVQESLRAVVHYRFWYGDRLLMNQIDANASFEFSQENNPL